MAVLELLAFQHEPKIRTKGVFRWGGACIPCWAPAIAQVIIAAAVWAPVSPQARRMAPNAEFVVENMLQRTTT